DRPALDRVALARRSRGPVAARVEREEPEALAEAVVDETEVVSAEQPAAELEDGRRVLGPGQLVVQPDTWGDVSERHEPDPSASSRPGPQSSHGCQSATGGGRRAVHP